VKQIRLERKRTVFRVDTVIQGRLLFLKGGREKGLIILGWDQKQFNHFEKSLGWEFNCFNHASLRPLKRSRSACVGGWVYSKCGTWKW
jgi:hypothetical protein